LNKLIDLNQRYAAQKIRIHSLSREAGWIVAGQAASVLGSLVLVRVLTEYLESAEYGQLALGLTVATLVNQVVLGGLIAGIGRFYSIATEKGDLWGYLSAARRMLIIATAVVIALGIILISILAAVDMRHWLWLVTAVLVFSILSSYNSALNGIQNAARQRAIVALHGGMDAWLKIGLAVGVMLWLGVSSGSVVMGYALAALVITLSQLFFLKRHTKRLNASRAHANNENWINQIWQFSWPFSAFGIFTWVQQVSDRWALENFATTSEVGQYAVLFQLGYAPIGILTGLIMSLIGPILYQRSGAVNDVSRNSSVHRIAWRITQASLALTTMGFAVTWLFHEWLFRWLVSEAFRDISFLLPWVVLAGGLFAAGQMLSLKLMSELRSQTLLTVKIPTALLGISANTLGAWLYGLEGVVGALILFSATYLGWVMKHAIRLPPDNAQQSNNRI